MGKKEKQVIRVLNFMRRNDGITTWEAFQYLNILSLPRRIKDLREMGYNINMTYQRTPDGERYGLYKLVEENR